MGGGSWTVSRRRYQSIPRAASLSKISIEKKRHIALYPTPCPREREREGEGERGVKRGHKAETERGVAYVGRGMQMAHQA